MQSKQAPTLFYQQKWFAFLLVFVLIASIASFFINQRALRLIAEQQEDWDGVIPGQQYHNVVDEFEQKYEPVDRKEFEDRVVYQYESDFLAVPHEVVVSDEGVVIFAREMLPVDTKEFITDTLREYGEADRVLIPDANTIELGYLFVERGLLIMAIPDGQITERWYFSPTTVEGFLANWGDYFSETGSGPE